MTRDCPCFACQCEPNQVTKDAIKDAREIAKNNVESGFIVTLSKDNKAIEKNTNAWLAIQDVLALHEIDEYNYTLRYDGNDNQVRDETCQCGDDYPCETRTAITKRLEGME